MAAALRWTCVLALLALLALLARADTTTPAAESDPPRAQEEATPGATAAQALSSILGECALRRSLSCVRPRVLSFLSAAARQDEVLLTQDLSLQRTGASRLQGEDKQGLLERVDDYLASHQLQVRLPQELVSGELAPYVPKFLLRDLPPQLAVPLADPAPASQERGFMKRIVMPFLLGLKFKATALVPLALGLIALKTWKALTLGLLSLVLSGAMLVFKLTKPKVVNYEVYHYPQHAPAVLEHTAPAAAYDAHHGWGRAHDLAFSGQAP
ncbi:uncharacterized protein LOC134539310 [Bacillus rossius redtenbacheri]|uniref:uncharacterized protein LOC134539310 n=1 Tax=Bacillus rossius redtenbacheri TaxID=93214 RepID=UPI002FDECAEE